LGKDISHHLGAGSWHLLFDRLLDGNPQPVTMSQLDPYQLLVVNAPFALPQIVVMSGPGSGKTRTAIERVRELIVHNQRVVVLTFTNAAAREFLNRLGAAAYARHLVVADTKVSFCGTLHSYCYRLVRRFAKLAGYANSNITILPEDDQDLLLCRIRDKLNFKRSIKQVHAQPYDLLCKQIWSEYYFLLRRNSLIDYDEILSRGLFLLTLPRVREEMGIDTLVIEEAQDSAEIDWGIYKSIPAKHRFFIGDIDQAIFEFRKAYPQGFLDTIAEHDTTTFRLEYNYRCSRMICEAANNLIRHNKHRYEKSTLSVTPDYGRVTVTKLADQWEEARWLMARFTEWTPEKEVAVLCRVNHDIDKLRYTLISHGVSVFTARENGERPEDWRRALLLVGLMASPHNNYLAEQFLLLDNSLSVVRQWELEAHTTGSYLSERIGKFEPLASWPTFLASRGVSAATCELINQIYLDLPGDTSPTDLLEELHTRHAEHRNHKAQAGQIYCGTIHSAKGREFDCVFLPAFEDLPKLFDKNIEEERRLVFVALTRARFEVHISWAQVRRPEWGERQAREISRFVREMELPNDANP
jgi:DNA helicase-2/ATP-dependent DNA helicase PcrA